MQPQPESTEAGRLAARRRRQYDLQLERLRAAITIDHARYGVLLDALEACCRAEPYEVPTAVDAHVDETIQQVILLRHRLLVFTRHVEAWLA